jgi:ferric-dicitrate binding protein FerR (iron transport regulator)/Mg-chelatase subunit ChlD
LVTLLEEHHAGCEPSVSPSELVERAMAGRKDVAERGDAAGSSASPSPAAGDIERGGEGGILAFLRRPRVWAVAAGAAAAVALAVVAVMSWPQQGKNEREAKRSPRYVLAAVQCRSVAPSGKSVERECHPDGKNVLSTGRDERLEVTLSDETVVWLNHSTRVEIEKDENRALELVRGEALLDVVRQKGLPSLKVALPTGGVEVVGTKLQVKAQGEYSFVDVVRGKVVVEAGGKKRAVMAGGEAVLARNEEPVIQPASNLGVALEWAEVTHGRSEGPGGFGSLTARRPGKSDDDDQALRLVDHKVRVKVRGRMVRTEIEEEFFNDSNHTMEGIYKFPLPSDAKIAALDLEVNGEWKHGAVVERKRGDKIWRGVIRRATPKKKRKKREEFVWVPGPWRDPALLKWKQGNQFELRIFPIPKKGSRKVRIAYTQLLKPVPGGRRYVLPLAAAPSGKPRSEKFDLEVSIGGLSDSSELRISPYELSATEKKGEVVLGMKKESFAPKGDIVIDIPDDRPAREVQAYSYKSPTRGRREGFALLALRPKIPYKASAKRLDLLFVVDSSYSMQTARLKRAASMIETLTRELGAKDRVAVMSCATRCRMASEGFVAATPAAAERLKEKVAGLEPLGSSRLAAAFEKAGRFMEEAGVGPATGRVIYLGDGVPTVGEIETVPLAAKVKESLGGTRLTTVSLGGQIDELTMKALAHAGGGAFVSYPAGAKLGSVAFTVLQRQWAEPLREAGLLLPSGVSGPVPEELDEIWPGEEKLVAVRVSGDIADEVVLTGKLDGEELERRYRVTLRPRPRGGNAFLPRLWAEMRIAMLEHKGGRSDRDEVVELSKRYHVLSRHTSLLVLESKAMAKAFGVEDTRPEVEWTGDADLHEEETAVLGGTGGGGGKSIGGGGFAADGLSAKPRRAAKSSVAPLMRGKVAAESAASSGPSSGQVWRPRRRPRRMIRMKRVWYRVAAISRHEGARKDESKELRERVAAFEKNPDSRDRTRELLRWYVRSGELTKAEETARHWLSKDRLDAGALVELAGISALKGKMEKGRELLASAVDVDPRNAKAHTRMYELYQAAGEETLMCDHALTRSIVASRNRDYAVSAARCDGDAARHLADLDDRARRKAKKELEQKPKQAKSFWDRLIVKGEWSGGRDVDIVVITPKGRVVSWMGGARRVKSRHVFSHRREALACSMWERGLYQIVMVPVERRGAGKGSAAINGKVTIESYKSKKTLSFASNGEPVRLARIRIRSKSKLVRAPVRRF